MRQNPITAQRDAFLGIEKSVTGKRWEERSTDTRMGLALAQQMGMPEIVGRVLSARGVTPENVEAFLEPRLRDLMPDPSVLQDMEKAAERLAEAVAAGEKIAVFGDYDVDGATSSALLGRFFAQLGQPLRIYIPDRLAEGYGPNTPALLKLRAEGIDLVITVDCGITSFDPLEAAFEAGLEVVVVDHHTAEPRLPRATAVINPNRLDDTSGLGRLAAVGVTFLLLVALNRALRQRGWFAAPGRREPNLKAMLDIVALGTVCDVVPLTGLNRAFVAQGLKVLAQRGNPGLAALCDVAGMKERPESFHLGFVLGPRINAGGRVGESHLGAHLLSSDDLGEATNISQRLDGYNRERQEIEAAVLDQAIIAAESLGDAPLLLIAGEGWHPGVIGIVASRLKDRYARPTIVIALEDGQGKGSGRSVPGVDLGTAVVAARQAGLLVNGGGHPMAAGLTVASAALGELREFLQDHIGKQLEAAAYHASLGIDGAIQPGGATKDLLEQLDACGPFGVGNAQPRFVIPDARIEHAAVVGSDHVRCRVVGIDGKRLKAISFRAFDNPLGETLLQTRGLPLHLAGKLKRDNWMGADAVQFIIEDAALKTG